MTLTALPDHARDVDELDDVGCPKSVLGKAHLILAAFGAGADQLGLTELSRRSGVPKASAYRLARELTHWGLLERVGDSYQLGIRMFELGQRVPVASILRGVARPYLADLYALTRAAIHLAVLDGGHVLYVDKVAGDANVRTPSDIGSRLPASCTATGKVLLAHNPSAMDRCDRLGLVRLTSRSTASVADLRATLAVVQVRGFAVEREETLPGHGSVAVPVMGYDGSVHAAVSATLPVSQLGVERLVAALRATANHIARELNVRSIGVHGRPEHWSGLPA